MPIRIPASAAAALPATTPAMREDKTGGWRPLSAVLAEAAPPRN